MKQKIFGSVAALLSLVGLHSFAAENSPTPAEAAPAVSAPMPVDAEAKKAAEWVASLDLNDAEKSARVSAVIATHLRAIRDWHNGHQPASVPAGVNPKTGTRLDDLDRQMIADSAQPKSYHTDLMAGLRQDLTEPQVEAILDKYTIGKVAFTMNGYRSIVPDLTPKGEETILKFLKEAREESIDYKNVKEISAIFEIYKTKSEQFLNSNGRDWKQLYKAYSDAAKAKKAADAAAKAAKP